MKIEDPTPKKPSVFREDIVNISESFRDLSDNLSEFINVAQLQKSPSSEAVLGELKAISNSINKIELPKDKTAMASLSEEAFWAINNAITELRKRLYELKELFEKTSSRQDVINIPQDLHKERIKIESKIKDFNEGLATL